MRCIPARSARASCERPLRFRARRRFRAKVSSGAKRRIFPAPSLTCHTQNGTYTVRYGCVNVVSLVGQLSEDPDLRLNRGGIEECRMRLAVPRRSRDGRIEPGIVFVDVTTFGQEARECAERLSAGDRIGLSGRLEVDEHLSEDGEWEAYHGVLIDQIDLL